MFRITARRSVLPVAVGVALTLALTAPAASAQTSGGPALPDGSEPSTNESVLRPGAQELTLTEEADDATVSDGSIVARAVPGKPSLTRTKLSSVSATFTYSASNGGKTITGYTVKITQNGSSVGTFPTTATTFTINNLVPETTYSVTVTAKNADGTSVSSNASTFTTPLLFIERQYGQNRFETAARVSYRAFLYSGIGAAFVASGRNFPDALSAAAAAGGLGGPVLLTEPTKLPAATAGELNALDPSYVVIAGGTGSVSKSVMNQASEYATVDGIRLAGDNRYGTSAQVSSLWSTSNIVYLASGKNFPDALAGAAAAGALGAPVLLTDPGTLSPETKAALARLRPSKIVVLGGTGAVSNAVVKKAKAATGVTTTSQRLSGATRYDTAVAISKATFPTPGVPVVYVASGASFPDALAGAAAAGYRGGPVLLTAAGSATPSVLAEIKRLKPQRIVVLGGPTIVSNNVVNQIKAATK